jgi:hypothetical protein
MVPETNKTFLKKKGFLIALGVAFVLASLIFGTGLLLSRSTSISSTNDSTTTATYNVGASSVLVSAARLAPAGYTGSASRQLSASEPGLESGSYATLSTRGGSDANMTILVFDTPASAQTYMKSVVANAKGLSGYTDISSMLAPYQRYGSCYGFGQDNPFGAGAVATGICTRGNVYIQVHLATASTLSSLESDLSALVGAAYQGIG